MSVSEGEILEITVKFKLRKIGFFCKIHALFRIIDFCRLKFGQVNGARCVYNCNFSLLKIIGFGGKVEIVN